MSTLRTDIEELKRAHAAGLAMMVEQRTVLRLIAQVERMAVALELILWEVEPDANAKWAAGSGVTRAREALAAMDKEE